MVHREKIILKIARRTITIPEIHRLNSALSGAKGFDYQDLILERHDFSRGKKFGPDNYYILRDGDVIDNAFLSGDYHGAQVFLNKKPEEKKPEIPWDAYFTPAHFYDEWEKENEK